jgi:hypothetical protein
VTDHKILRWAKAYAAAGYKIFPCKPGTKVPLTRNGVLDATTDLEIVEGWFTRRPDLNIGLACGPQPNGVNLLAIDVDAHKGGAETWDGLIGDRLLNAPHHFTPNGGLHVFLDAPQEYRNSRERIGEGIDTRGSGGYVVVPPSTFPVGDPAESKSYTTVSDFALVTHRPPPVPDWLTELLQPQVDAQQRPERDVRPVTPAGDDDSPGDWIRRHGDWEAELLRFGWSHAHGDYWTRPGKSVREGHSAVLHDGGPLVIFTTDVPPELERVGHPTQDRTGIAVSLFELIAAYEFGGDLSAAGREIRKVMPAAPGRGAVVSRPEACPTEEGVPGDGLNLAAEFWEARDVLRLIRDAAWQRLVSPDALLVNALARSATLIPPSLKLPPIIGTEATFDFLGCVVAETSGGKSITAGVGKDLLPDPGLALHQDERVYMFDMPIGSGEGIAQAFMVPERKEDENGKEKFTGRQIVGKQALHFVVDESTGLVAQAQRKGTTIIPTLLSAWSGQTLGQLNASAETRRIVEGGRCRVAAVMNMQSSNAWMLFTEEMTTLGLTSRMLFANAHDPAAPDDDDLEWPGTLSFAVPVAVGRTQHVTYDDAIARQLIAERRAVLRGGVGDKATGHTSLLRCKVASILAVWEGRQHVTVDDWALAGMVVGTSARVLAHLDQLRAVQVRNNREAAAAARGESEHVAETAKERRAIDDLSKRIIARVPPEGVGRRELMKALTSSSTRHRFEPALERAIESGRVRIDDGRLFQAS